MPLKSMTVDVDALQSGSGDPSPTNIRPISGRTGCKVTRTGKNIFGGTLLRDGVKAALPSATINENDKTVNFSANATASGAITDACGLTGKFKENTVYTFFMTFSKNAGESSNLFVRYTDNAVEIIPASGIDKQTSVFVSASNKTVRYLGKRNSSGTTYLYYEESGIFEGELTADDFVPYVGQTYDITFPDSAGTVYGGSLDVVNGKLLDDYDWAIAQADGTFKRKNGSTLDANGYRTGGYVFYKLGASGSVRGHAKCNMYPTAALTQDYGVVVYSASSESRMTFHDTSVPGWTEATSNAALAAAWTQYVADQYAQGNILFVIWRNGTAVEYDIDPVTIRTLLGLNNIWADTGAIEECVYAADTKMYIENLTKPSEDDLIANSAIAAGKFFMIGNRLFLSTASIANGATINPGTNCTELSLSEALNTLNA